MLRSVCHLQVDEGMLRSCFTYYWSCSSGAFSTKSDFRTFTGIFNYLPLYWGPDRPDSMLYYLFWCCGSIVTLPEPQFLLLPTVTCAQSDHVSLPKSPVTSSQQPAEMQKSQLWTLITFFWLCLVTPNFTKVSMHVYLTFVESLLRFCAAKKKSIFKIL